MTKIYNPKTKKFIDSESKKFNNTIDKLKSEFTLINNILVPNDKTNWGYSSRKGYWVQKNKIINKLYTTENDVLKFKDEYVYGIKGRVIKKNSRVYNSLLNQGYQYDEVLQKLIKPLDTIEEQLSVKEFAILISETEPKPYKMIFKNENEDIYRIIIYKNNTQAVENFRITSNSGEYPLDVYFIYRDDYIKFGPAYESSKNCVIDCVKLYFENKKYKLPIHVSWEELYNKYKEGIMEDDFKELAEIIKCTIIIYENDNIITHKITHKKSPLIIEYKNNHCMLKSNSKSEETISIDNNCDCINNLEYNKTLIHTCQNINNTFHNIDINIINEIYLQQDRIIGYRTIDNITYKNKFDIIELKDDEFTYMSYLKKNIHNYFSNKITSINDNCDIINQITNNTIFYSNINLSSNFKLDMTKAYDNFRELPTDLIYKINTDKFIDKIGYSYITYIDPITNLENTRWLANIFIKEIFIKYNINFTIYQGMYSSNSTILDLQKFYNDNKTIYNCDKRMFHKILGIWQKYEYDNFKITTDTSIIKKYGGMKLKDDLYYYNTKKSYIRTNNYYPHIVGYIHAYTNIKIYDTILKYNLKPIKIWVDGITLPKEEINRFTNWEKIKEGRYKCNIKGFHIEESKKCDYECITSKIHTKLDIINNKIIPFSEYKVMRLEERKLLTNYLIELPKDYISIISGEGGSGKSTIIKSLENIYKCTILTPTNMVKKQYKNAYTVYSHLYPKFKKYIYGILIIDEYSLVSQEDLNMLLSLYRPVKVLLFGDLVQLPIIEGTPITKYNIEYLTYNYRSEFDTELLNYQQQTRINGNIDYLKNKRISIEDAILNNSIILSTTNFDVNKINNIGLKLNNNKLIPNSELKINTPIIITTNYLEKEYGIVNSDYGFIKDFNEVDNTIILNISNDIINLDIKYIKYIKPAYSLTYHKVQGLTILQNVVLNLNKIDIFNRNGKDIIKNLLYVAVSRVKKLDQLFILVNTI